jgi:polysaccharide biosynthesis protein PslG
MRLRALLVAICSLCLVPAAAHASAPPLVGTATHPLWSDSSRADFDQELDMVKGAGGNAVRIDIGWATLESEAKGSYNTAYVSKADQFFADAHARGLRVVATLWQTPCWASRAPESAKQSCSAGWWDRGVDKYPPTNPQDFADAAAYVAGRWGADLAALEIWNEPNYNPDFFNTDSPAADYAAILNATYPAVKAVAPGVAVIGPAMLDSDWLFLDDLYDRGLAAHSDGVSLRPFNGGRDPRSTAVPEAGEAASYLLGVPHVRDVMAAHGDSATKLWFTELGWSSCTGTSSWCVGEDKQAQYIADAYRIARDNWDFVQLFSIYTLRNTGTSETDRESQMGMVRQDFAPKPAFGAFEAVLAEPLPQPAAHAVPPQPPSPPTPAPTPTKKARPELSRLRLSHGVLSYRLGQRSRVSLTLQRWRHGRWVGVRRPSVLKGKRGINRVRLGKLLGKRRLPAGRYRLTFVARDASGARSAPSRITFRLR